MKLSKQNVAAALEVAGGVSLVIAAALLSVAAAFVTAGVLAIGFGIALELSAAVEVKELTVVSDQQIDGDG